VLARKIERTSGDVIFDVTYTIDEHGLRKTESSPVGQTVAFFLDSFTFGEGVNDGDTLPQAFANLMGHKVPVVNAGFHGYGPQAFLRTLETGIHDDVPNPDPILFVIQTAAWRAERAACRPDLTWTTPRYALIDGRVVYRGSCPDPAVQFLLKQLKKSHLWVRLVRPLLDDRERDIDLYLAILREAVALASRKYDARVIVLYLRSDNAQFEGTSYTDEKIMDLLEQSGAVVIDATLEVSPGVYLTDYYSKTDLVIPGDGHPSPRANHLRAGLYSEAIIRAGLIQPYRSQRSDGNAVVE